MICRLRARGMTLVELMIVVLVVAILGAIAVPSYRSYVLRSKRTDARTALLRVQGAQEKFFLQNSRYTDQLTAAPDGLGLAPQSDHQYYEIAIAPGPEGIASSYVVTATPSATGGQFDDSKCRAFSVDQNGGKAAQDSGGGDRTEECWR